MKARHGHARSKEAAEKDQPAAGTARRASGRGNSVDTKTAEVAAQAHGQDAWRVMPQSWRAMITKEAAGCERQQPKGRRQARVASEAGRQRTQRMLKGAKRTRLRIADRRPRQRRVTMKGTSRMPAPRGFFQRRAAGTKQASSKGKHTGSNPLAPKKQAQRGDSEGESTQGQGMALARQTRGGRRRVASRRAVITKSSRAGGKGKRHPRGIQASTRAAAGHH